MSIQKALGHIFGMSLSQLQPQLCFNSGVKQRMGDGFRFVFPSFIGFLILDATRSVRCKHCGDKSVHCRSEYCFCVTCPLEKNGERHFNMDVKDGGWGKRSSSHKMLLHCCFVGLPPTSRCNNSKGGILPCHSEQEQ